jgi:NADPH:quinone reductase-like Zn-dependent oxidoreductase
VRVIEIPAFGPPSVLRLADRPEPSGDADHPRIRVHAAGVNFADLMMRMGLYPEAPAAPFVPGYEVAGTLDDGRRVVAFTRFGGYAETVTAPLRAILPLPDSMSFEEGAALPVCSSTAWVALVHMARVASGDTVLVEHAAGGVGIAAIQIAKRAGAVVYGVTGSPAKMDFLKGLGVSPLLRGQKWPDGLDIILDPTGLENLERDLSALAAGGRVVLYGFSDYVEGPVRKAIKTLWRHWRRPHLDPVALFNRNIGVFGLNMLTFADRRDVMARCATEIAKGVAENWLRPRVDRAFPLDRAAEAHQWMHDRKNVGKIVLKIRE